MLDAISKRIQSRLTRKGISVSLSAIREQVISLIPDLDNATDTDLNNVIDHFISQHAALIPTNDSTIIEEQPDPICNLINAIALRMNISLSSEDRVAIEGKLPSTNPEDIKGAIVDYLKEKSQLATTTKNELVATAANSLNIQLSTVEIEAIATNFNASSDDFTATLEELKSAILAFIAHKVSTNNQIISNVINEIYSVATDGFESNNQHLNDGLSQLNKALNQQSSDFKSRLKNTLEKFKLPAV